MLIKNLLYAATELTYSAHVYLQLTDFQEWCRALVRSPPKSEQKAAYGVPPQGSY